MQIYKSSFFYNGRQISGTRCFLSLYTIPLSPLYNVVIWLGNEQKLRSKDLEALDSWLSGNILSLNVATTQSMTFSTKHKQTALERKNELLCLQIRNETPGAVQNTKYLAVLVDNSIDSKKHIQEASRKISLSLGMLKYAKGFLSMHLKISTPVSLILASGTVVLCRVCVVLPKSTRCRNFKIELSESPPVAITMSLVNH